MAHQLKLTIWKILLKPSYGDAHVPNSELFSRIKAKAKRTEPLDAFLQEFFAYFDGKFKKNKNGNQSVTPKAGAIKINKNRNLIYGFMEGGVTGIESIVKPNSNSKDIGKSILNDEVVSLDNYFHIWIPQEVNYAYIMLQSYSNVNRGISGAFFEHFIKFLQNYSYVLAGREMKVPKPIQDAFQENSIIVGMDLIKEKTSPVLRRNFNPALQDVKPLRYKLSITGMKFSYSEFMEKMKFRNRNPFFINLSALGMENPDDYKTIVKYRDPISKRSASAELSDIIRLKPSIIIPDSVKLDGKEVPDIQKISQFCDKQLKLLLIDDDYATIDEYPDN